MHDILEVTNHNRIAPKLRGISLKSQLFGRARDLVSKISKAELTTTRGAKLIVAAIRVRDTISCVGIVFRDYTLLQSIRRKPDESYASYEGRFSAQVAKFNSNGEILQIHDSLLEMQLLGASNVDDVQRIPILTNAVPFKPVSELETNGDVCARMTYEHVASVLRQCDNKSEMLPQSKPRNDTFNSNSANYSNHHQ